MKKTLLSLILFAPCIGFSQTINTGELYVSPGTQLSTVGALDNKATGDIINDGELFVYDHYNNDGLVTFTTAGTTGITRMRGASGYQSISGTMPMEWYNAEFSNNAAQPAFHLSTEVSVSGQANFQKGIVDGDAFNGLMVFEKGASHINVDDISHVDGLVRKNGNDSFTYPIGDKGKYRYAAISGPAAVNDAFTSKYFLENSNTSYSHTSKTATITLIDNAEYWTIDKTAGNSNVFLTLSWNAATTPSTIFAAPYEAIHIVRWDDTQKRWVDEGGVADDVNKEVTMVVNPLIQYGVFTLARVKLDTSLMVYNAVSPNEDGKNDFFRIDGLELHPNNTVTIFNRWGVQVFETKGYGKTADANVFKGISEGRVTVSKNEKLPAGTYFYVVEVINEFDASITKKSGYLYINDK
ncbi:MAG: hypothetical protein C0412_10095 [Flavobacterium sp.]|nr:hypothetical protein [Flavobacterium sp.]